MVSDLNVVTFEKLRMPYPCKRVVKRCLRKLFTKGGSAVACENVRRVNVNVVLRCVCVCQATSGSTG